MNTVTVDSYRFIWTFFLRNLHCRSIANQSENCRCNQNLSRNCIPCSSNHRSLFLNLVKLNQILIVSTLFRLITIPIWFHSTKIRNQFFFVCNFKITKPTRVRNWTPILRKLKAKKKHKLINIFVQCGLNKYISSFVLTLLESI